MSGIERLLIMLRLRIIGIFLTFNIACAVSFIGGNIKGSINILPIENNSNQYGAQGFLGSIIYNEFKEDGRFRISEKGDYTLKITIKDFKKEPFFYESSGKIKGYKFTLISDFVFIRNIDTLSLIKRSLREEIILNTDDEIMGLKNIGLKLKDDIIKSVLELW